MPPNATPGSTPSGPGAVRHARCSVFFAFEWDPALAGSPEKSLSVAARGEVVELQLRDPDDPLRPPTQPPPPGLTIDEAEKRGVRVDRECLTVVLRRQTHTRPPKIPTYVQLHDVRGSWTEHG